MLLDSMMLYSCCYCGELMSGMEWSDWPDKNGDKEYRCPVCAQGLNKDELYSEED